MRVEVYGSIQENGKLIEMSWKNVKPHTMEVVALNLWALSRCVSKWHKCNSHSHRREKLKSYVVNVIFTAECIGLRSKKFFLADMKGTDEYIMFIYFHRNDDNNTYFKHHKCNNDIFW
jgi:hypothetical protein